MNYAIREVELNHVTPGLKRIVKDTLKVFRDAVKMLSDIALTEWDGLKDLDNQDQLTYMKNLSIQQNTIRQSIRNSTRRSRNFLPTIVGVQHTLPADRYRLISPVWNSMDPNDTSISQMDAGSKKKRRL